MGCWERNTSMSCERNSMQFIFIRIIFLIMIQIYIISLGVIRFYDIYSIISIIHDPLRGFASWISVNKRTV